MLFRGECPQFVYPPLTGVRSTRLGCRAVRDSTLMAWYRSIYAPRTGGAYDSHHRTAGIAGCARRRGGGRLAARGARAATRADAAHRRAPYLREIPFMVTYRPTRPED